MKFMLFKIAREFGIDARLPFRNNVSRACNLKRKCANSCCKNKLNFKGFLESNLINEGKKFETKLEFLTKLWNDPQVEFYCCYCFPHFKRGDLDNMTRQAVTWHYFSRQAVFRSILFSHFSRSDHWLDSNTLMTNLS
ncbi:MAG TPA: hypothetical protein VKM55_11105 [Candidatus Lokiarchaeia archaeon]|nr:hypothetical protein [Candidatus Lokiarchaeia archaeon]